MSGETERTETRSSTAETIDLPAPRRADLPVVRERELPERAGSDLPARREDEAEEDEAEPGRFAGLTLAASVAFFLTSAVWYVVTTAGGVLASFGLAVAVPWGLSAGFLLSVFGLAFVLTYWIPLFVLAILSLAAGLFGLTAAGIVLLFGASAMPTGFVILLGTTLAPAVLLALGLKHGAVRP
jgi:hypothetical protein